MTMLETDRANARLIAAAPEMLAMLEKAHRIIQSRFAGTHTREDRIGLALMNDLRVTIAKAEGR